MKWYQCYGPFLGEVRKWMFIAFCVLWLNLGDDQWLNHRKLPVRDGGREADRQRQRWRGREARRERTEGFFMFIYIEHTYVFFKRLLNDSPMPCIPPLQPVLCFLVITFMFLNIIHTVLLDILLILHIILQTSASHLSYTPKIVSHSMN